VPDLLLEIVTANKITDDFGLYTPKMRMIMELRQKIINSVVKKECEMVAREHISRYVD
jgi:hypothetical protein